MHKNIIITIIAIILVAVVVAVYFQKKESAVVNKIPPRNDTVNISNTITVIRNDLGFNPKNLTINQGDTVVFTNISFNAFWPASDDHPDHLIYPEFDSKKPILAGESYSFTFDKVGTWKFHNHSKPSETGMITVID